MEGFRFYLIAWDGTVVGVCRRPEPLRPGDVITLGRSRERWEVYGTLGQVARVQPPASEAGESMRVSASSEAVARAFAAEVGGGAACTETARSWIVSVPVGPGQRVATLAHLAAAARAVEKRSPHAELFVLDQGRPVRIPPPL